MKLQLNPLTIILIFMLTIVIISGTGKEEKYGNYSTVYNDNEYIVLKRNAVSNKAFVPNPEHGKLIRDSVAEAEIKLYRQKYPDATRYIDFNFNNLLAYVASFQNVENTLDNLNLGIRIYPAIDLHTKQLTVIISPTKNDRALWRNNNTLGGRTAVEPDVEAFNTGAICPVNCPDSTDMP